MRQNQVTMSVLALALLAGQPYSVTPFDVSERLKRFDVAWAAADSASKRAAIPKLESYFSSNLGAKAQALDQATAALEKQMVQAGDALSIRIEPFAEAGAAVTLRLNWCYRPASVVPVEIRVGFKSVRLRPGSAGALVVEPSDMAGELRLSPESGYLIPVRVNGEPRGVYVSFVRGWKGRIEKLVAAKNAAGEFLHSIVAEPVRSENELALIQVLFDAEAMEEGRRKLPDFDQVLFARQGETALRAQFPLSLKGVEGVGVKVVMAIHGSGGNESTFFETHGRGAYPREATKRGWVFISPRAGDRCGEDAVEWLEKVRKLKVEKLFLIGHMDGDRAVVLPARILTPWAVAILSPVTRQTELSKLQFSRFVAYAEQDSGPRVPGVKTYAPSHRLTTPADAVADVFEFFDGVVQRDMAAKPPIATANIR